MVTLTISRHVSLVCIVAFAHVATPALAAPPPPAIDQAESIAQTAARRFKERQFVIAGELFLRAYGLTPRPALLFNAARSYEEAGDNAKALELFRDYAKIADDAGGRADAQVRIGLLEKAAPKTASAPQPVEPPSKPELHPAAAPLVSSPIAPNVVRPNVVVQSVSSPSRTPAVVVLTGGAVMSLAGVGFLLASVVSTNGLESDLAKRDAGGHIIGLRQSELSARNDTIARDKTLGAVLGGMGVAAVGVGAYLWLRPSGSSEPAVWVAPGPGSLAFGGRF